MLSLISVRSFGVYFSQVEGSICEKKLPPNCASLRGVGGLINSWGTEQWKPRYICFQALKAVPVLLLVCWSVFMRKKEPWRYMEKSFKKNTCKRSRPY